MWPGKYLSRGSWKRGLSSPVPVVLSARQSVSPSASPQNQAVWCFFALLQAEFKGHQDEKSTSETGVLKVRSRLQSSVVHLSYVTRLHVFMLILCHLKRLAVATASTSILTNWHKFARMSRAGSSMVKLTFYLTRTNIKQHQNLDVQPQQATIVGSTLAS